MKVAFYIAESGNFVDKIINLWTGFYGYSHCEIVFENFGPTEDYHKYLCCSAAPREGKVRFKEIDIYSKHWHVIDLDDDINENTAFDYVNKMIGAKYDWKGILLYFIFMFIKKQDKNKWWCSEFVGNFLNEFYKPTKFRVSPNRLAKKLGLPRQPFKFMFLIKKNF